MNNRGKDLSDRELLALMIKSSLKQGMAKQADHTAQLESVNKHIQSLSRDNKKLTDAVLALANQVIVLSNQVVCGPNNLVNLSGTIASKQNFPSEETLDFDEQDLGVPFTESKDGYGDLAFINDIESPSAERSKNKVGVHVDLNNSIDNILKLSLGFDRYKFYSQRIDLKSFLEEAIANLERKKASNCANLIRALEFKKETINMFIQHKVSNLETDILCDNRFGKALVDLKFESTSGISLQQVNKNLAEKTIILPKDTFAVKCIVEGSESIGDLIKVIKEDYNNVLVVVPEGLDVSKSTLGITSPTVKIVKGNITYLKLDSRTTHFIYQIRSRYRQLLKQKQ